MKILAPLIALSLCSCGPMLTAMGGPAPAPLTRTTIDDTALMTAWRAFDVALDAINIMTDRGLIVPGTPKARRIATAIRTVNRALATAERFAAAGSATDYGTALREATAGMNEIRSALGEA
jgi:hypothetical protein